MASTEIDFQPAKPKKTGLAGSWDGFKTFCYNPQNGAICGRTIKSWAKICLFYLVYYSLLAAFCAMMAAVFFTTISEDEPRQQGMDSLIKGNPGMAFVPMPNSETTLINYHSGEKTSYSKYVTAMRKYLKPYGENETKKWVDETQDCEKGRDTSGKPCRFNMANLGQKCTSDNTFGYYEGRPCVIMKMNKVFGWEPETFNNETLLPHLVGKHVHGFIPVTCEGEQYSDQDGLKSVEFFPPGGFQANFFPYKNKPGHLSPIVMARFHVEPGKLLQIWCKVWAPNIYHHKNDKAGSFRFEMLVN